MSEQEIDKTGWHRLDKILDYYDHFQSEEEKEQAKNKQSLTEKYRHLQPDYQEDDIEYF